MADLIRVLMNLGLVGLFVFAGIVLLWFGWHVFLRKYWRAWHIARIRETRELREAMRR
jgi:hypothetical protein